MKTKYSRLVVLCLIAHVMLAISSCNYDDVLGDKTGQDSLVRKCSITGFVLDENNHPVDSWITLNDHTTGKGLAATSTSRANGSAYSKYSIDVTNAGTYDIICGAGGYYNDTSTVVVDGTENIIIHNITLKSDGTNSSSTTGTDSITADKDDISEKDMISDGKGTMYGYIITNSITDNDLAKIRIELLTDSADAKNIRLSALYSDRDVRLSDSGQIMMIGARVTSTSGTQSNKNFTLTFSLDDKMAKLASVRYYDIYESEWVDVESTVENGKLKVKADKFGSYGVFVDGVVKQVETSNDTVFYVNKFNSDIYAITLENAIYTYMMGSVLFPSNGLDVLQALMVEYMAAKYGYHNESVSATFDFNGMKLQYDHGYKVWGVQKRSTFVMTSNGCMVECYKYGNISLYTFAYQYADHKGGGND